MGFLFFAVISNEVSKRVIIHQYRYQPQKLLRWHSCLGTVVLCEVPLRIYFTSQNVSSLNHKYLRHYLKTKCPTSPSSYFQHLCYQKHIIARLPLSPVCVTLSTLPHSPSLSTCVSGSMLYIPDIPQVSMGHIHLCVCVSYYHHLLSKSSSSLVGCVSDCKIAFFDSYVFTGPSELSAIR